MFQTQQKNDLAQIVSYTPPQLHTGKEWYIDWYSFDPLLNKLHRKKVKLNHIKNKVQRRKYAQDLILRIGEQLRTGWNPWIAKENEKSYSTFIEVYEHYNKVLTKKATEGIYREVTYTSYISYLKNLKEYNQTKRIPMTYIYQLDKLYIIDFLEYIHIDRNNSAQTRDNYLGWLNSFSTFLIQYGYLKTNPCEGIHTFAKWQKKKQRQEIPEDILKKVKTKVEEKNKYFLLAMYILFYMFVRPKEMSLLKISDFNLQKRILRITEDKSKNRKT
jgi:integrase